MRGIATARPLLLLRAFLAVLLLATQSGSVAHATSLAQWQQQGHVKLDAWLEPSESVAVGEQIRMVIEVSTDSWLTAGTRLGHLEIPNTLVMQRSQLATNYSRREGQQSWAVQRWELVLYPQAEGARTVPPVPVTLSISGPDRQAIVGTLPTPPLQFQAQLPDPSLTEAVPWVAASDLSLKVQWQPEPGGELRVGDSITRTITQYADNTTAAMLPAPPLPSNAKVQAYAAPPVLTDQQNRGAYSAQRVDEQTWLVQQGGQLTLPQWSIKWWDTEQDKLQSLVVPGGQWSVRHTPASAVRAYGGPLLVFLLVLSGLWLGLRWLRRRWQQGRVPLGWQFRVALLKRHYAEANRLLYLKRVRKQGTWLLAPDLSSGLRARWSQQQFAPGGRPSAGALWALWYSIRRPRGWRWPLAIPALNRLGQMRSNLEKSEAEGRIAEGTAANETAAVRDEHQSDSPR